MQPFVPESLPPKGIDWEALIPLIGRANRALATFDGILLGLPNPAMLLSPLSTQEAVLSSRIEGTQTNLEEVLRFEAGQEVQEESRRQDIQETINYRRALRRAEELLRDKPFCLNTLLELHRILLDSVRGSDRGKGKLRTVQNYIGRPGAPIEQAAFIPPEPMSLMEHLTNWERYYHKEEPDPVVQLAIVHAQFEIIHPFLDGNGRMGRILLPLFLYDKKLLQRPYFYLSAYLESHVDEYFLRLRALGQPGSWNRWIQFFLVAVSEQAAANSDVAKAIHRLYERLKKETIELTRSQYAVPMLDRIFERPIFRSTDLTDQEDMPSKQMVMSMLSKLREAGVLKVLRKGSGRRPQVLALAELINLCEGRQAI